MFGQIRRHQKWLWIVISSAVIISFVWYFNPNQQQGGGGSVGTGVVGEMYGEPVTLKSYTDASEEAILQYLFSYGEWPVDNEITRRLRPVERETRSRLFLIRKLKDLNIEVSDLAVADWIQNAFKDRETGAFHREVYDRFVAQLPQHGLKEQDFIRFVRHQVGISHLAALAGAPGKMITPQEAEREFRQAREKADTKLVLFTSSNFLAKVDMNQEAIAHFYTNRAPSYRLPERVQLTYVTFPASNYTAKADERLAGETNLTAEIDRAYLQRGPNFYTDANGQAMAPEAAKEKIREEMRHELAVFEARKAAIAFATDLEKMPITVNSNNPAINLEQLARSNNVPTFVTEPFSLAQGPMSIHAPAQLSQIAFQLSPEEPIATEPIVGEDAVFVIGLRSRIPSELPPLDAIQARVAEDFKRSEALRLARDAGSAFASSAAAAIAGGKNFDEVAQQAGLSVVDLPPVTRDQRSTVEGLPPQVDLTSVRSTAFTIPAGSVSNFVPARDGGYVMFAEKFIPAADEEVKEQLPTFVQELRRQNAGEAFNNWFASELKLAGLTLANDKQLED